MLVEQPRDCRPLLWVALQTVLHKVDKLVRPVAFNLGHINVENIVDKLSPLDIREGRIAGRQLVCKASERPDVDLLGILAARSDLWRDPVRCALLRLAPRLLLG